MTKFWLVPALCLIIFGTCAEDASGRCTNKALAVHSVFVSPTDKKGEFAFDAAATAAKFYRWDFGDGTRIEQGAASETHAFSAEGVYTVEVSATDGKENSEPKYLTVDARAGARALLIVNTPLVTKKTFTLVFLKPTQNALNFGYQTDVMKLPSKLSFTSKFEGSTINVFIGLAQIDSIALSGTKSTGAGTVSFNYKKGTVEYKLKGFQPLTQLLGAFGAINANVAGVVPVPLEIDIVKGVDAIAIFTNVSFNYKATFDKKGSGK